MHYRSITGTSSESYLKVREKVTRSNRIYEPRNKGVLRNPRHNASYSIGELDNLTIEIITLLEFFNFVSEVSRLQYE
jgi:hypothetical protein